MMHLATCLLMLSSFFVPQQDPQQQPAKPADVAQPAPAADPAPVASPAPAADPAPAASPAPAAAPAPTATPAPAQGGPQRPKLARKPKPLSHPSQPAN